MQRISMVETCDACHGLNTVFWTELMEEKDIWSASTDDLQTKGIQKLLINN
jgi:cytochrome c1